MECLSNMDAFLVILLICFLCHVCPRAPVGDPPGVGRVEGEGGRGVCVKSNMSCPPALLSSTYVTA